MRFDLTDLRLFLAVAEAGSITHGAANLGLSLAAASDRLREMEATGAVRLLDRGRRGVSLTQAGEALLHHARTILNQAQLMRGDLGRFAKSIRANIRLLANTAAVVDVLPGRLSAWLAQHPQVDIDLRERQSHDIARSVVSGFADIGVMSDAAAQDGLVLRSFAVSRLVAISARTHPLAAEKQVRFASLAEHYFIGLEDGALQHHIDAQADRFGATLRYRIRLRTFETICAAVGSGVGIAIVPETLARRHARVHRLSITPLVDAWTRRNLVACVASDRGLSPTVGDLFDHLADGSRVKDY